MAASTTTNFANAIRFAANNGARVINNSWSFDTSSPISEINNAITYAHGKGCIVVFHRAIKAVLYHSRQREHLLQR
ncbi:MAG: S8 family serine peptidase [Alistipes finegoldii]